MSSSTLDKTTALEVSQEDRLRAQVYRLLATLLRQAPDRELLQRLAAIDPGPQRPSGSMAEAWAQLAEAARRGNPGELRQEHFELFIGIGRGELVPFGCWYLTGFLMEKPLAELRQDLKLMAFQRREGVREPEDHAAALCETMSLIIQDGVLAFGIQQRFFQKHIHPWMGRFFNDLQHCPRADFYRAVGTLGANLMAVEQRYLAPGA
ncbi:MAG: molecular chaperone TorD family protein [Candidatus Competibacteraceae bacterium]|nr:molecular chaperone TorD family protein [Candidatus Competibacteraceae bacterium]